MKIPKTVKVGRIIYRVVRRPLVRHKGKPALGYIDYSTHEIIICTHSALHGASISKREQYDTFWHELTHAILRHMQHHINDDEKFVTTFATELTNAIISAEL